MPSETSSRTHLAVSNALAQLLLCRSDGSLPSLVFPLCIGKVFQSRFTSRLHVGCLLTEATPSQIVRFHFLGRLVLRILAFASAFRVLAVFALALALRMRTDLHWHRIAVSVLFHDLEDVLSRLCPARDPRAVPDEVRFDPHVLHPQHCHTSLGVIANSFRWLTLVQLCRYAVFELVQHVAQESTKSWLPFHHELSPCCESLVHTCIVTLVQCLCHEYVVHLRAERRVESRCRRIFCRRRLQLMQLIRGSEV